MEKNLKEMTVSASVEVTVGADYKPVKIRGFTSKTFDVAPGPEDNDHTVANAMNKEMKNQFQICWHQVGTQAQVDVTPKQRPAQSS